MFWFLFKEFISMSTMKKIKNYFYKTFVFYWIPTVCTCAIVCASRKNLNKRRGFGAGCKTTTIKMLQVSSFHRSSIAYELMFLQYMVRPRMSVDVKVQKLQKGKNDWFDNKNYSGKTNWATHPQHSERSSYFHPRYQKVLRFGGSSIAGKTITWCW